MITVYLIENEPYTLYTALDGNSERMGRIVGEWAWVGRCELPDRSDPEFPAARWEIGLEAL